MFPGSPPPREKIREVDGLMWRNDHSDPVARVRAFLDRAGYGGSIHETEDTIFTVEDASRAVGAPPEEILKSLMLMVDGTPVLALLSGVNRVDLRKVQRLRGARKVKMADAEWVFSYSGFRIGGVPPVGYPEQLPALLDEDLYRHAVVWAAAGTDHAFFPVPPGELERLTGGQRADIRKENV